MLQYAEAAMSNNVLAGSKLIASRCYCLDVFGRSKQCSKQKQVSRSNERSFCKRLTGMQFAVMQVLHDGGQLPG